MSDSFIWTLLGHLVCIAQWAAFILVDYAYLGRGRRFRHPCVWAALLALAVLTLSVLCGFGFFNIKSVVSNIIYLLVIATTKLCGRVVTWRIMWRSGSPKKRALRCAVQMPSTRVRNIRYFWQTSTA